MVGGHGAMLCSSVVVKEEDYTSVGEDCFSEGKEGCKVINMREFELID